MKRRIEHLLMDSKAYEEKKNWVRDDPFQFFFSGVHLKSFSQLKLHQLDTSIWNPEYRKVFILLLSIYVR